jgi:HEAT repeat protein
MLEDKDPGVRYWAAIGCLILGEKAEPAVPKIRSILDDPAPNVCIAAAEYLSKYDNPEEPLHVLKKMLYHPQEKVRLHAINTIDYLEEKVLPILDSIKDKLNDESDYVVRVTQKILADLEKFNIE